MGTEDFCYIHHHTPATTRCRLCDRRICGECAVDVADPVCLACRVDVRRRRRFLLAGLLVAAGALAFLGWHFFRTPPAEDVTTVAEARQAVARSPDDAALRFRLGLLASAASQQAEAESAWRETVRLQPDHLQAHRQLAALYFETDRRADARTHLDRVLAQVPDDPDALLMSRQLDRIAADEARPPLDAAPPTLPPDAGVVPIDAAVDVVADAAPPSVDASTTLQAEQARADQAEALAVQLGQDLAATEQERARLDGRLEAMVNQEVPAGFCAIPTWTRPLGQVAVGASVNRNPINMLYDTTTPLTALTRQAAERLQVRVLDRTTRMAGPQGEVDFPLGLIREFGLGTRQVTDLTVVICDACVLTGEDGILGNDLQRALNLQYQPNLARLLIAGCR